MRGWAHSLTGCHVVPLQQSYTEHFLLISVQDGEICYNSSRKCRTHREEPCSSYIFRGTYIVGMGMTVAVSYTNARR